MSKIYIPLPKKENLKLYLSHGFEGFFIGIKGYSYGFNNLLELDELTTYIDMIKESNKEIFITFNRLYYNSEINDLKEVIKSIIKLDITGICFSDLGVLNILNELKFEKEILWYSNHLGTNSRTVNFLNKRNVNYFLLSNEITIDEIIKIKNNSKGKIGCTLYGHLNMATSSRKLLTNYFEFINKSKDKNTYIIEDKVKKEDYIITEGFNTDFYTKKVLNGIKFFPELINNNIDFIYLDDYFIDSNNFYNVVEAFSSLRNSPNDKKYVNTLEKVVNTNTYEETYYGFLEKKTVYKVEDYE